MNTAQAQNQKGYTLLFAVLTSALVLGVAVFILSVTTKQYELSAAARNSAYSFYAADTGIECAAGAFFGVNGGSIDPATGATISCDNTTRPSAAFTSLASVPASLSPITNNVVSTAPGALDFVITSPQSGVTATCVRIVIYDGYDSATPQGHYTLIDARGYNKCTGAGAPDTTNPSTVERALRLVKKG